MRPNRTNMRTAVLRGHATATDLADYLVRRGLPFRDAHAVVGRAVAHAIQLDVDLASLELPVLQSFSPLILSDVLEILTPEGAVAARNHKGATAPNQVRAAIAQARQQLAICS